MEISDKDINPVSLAYIPKDHNFCETCGAPMKYTEVPQPTFDRITGKKAVKRVWECSRFGALEWKEYNCYPPRFLMVKHDSVLLP